MLSGQLPARILDPALIGICLAATACLRIEVNTVDGRRYAIEGDGLDVTRQHQRLPLSRIER